MASVGEIKERTRRILFDRIGRVTEDRDGDFVFEAGSATAFITHRQWAEYDQTLVEIWSILARGITPSFELYRWVALRADSFVFGHLAIDDDDDGGGLVKVGMFHRLLGEDLDHEELMAALGAILGSIEQLDQEIVGEFGGRTFAAS